MTIDKGVIARDWEYRILEDLLAAGSEEVGRSSGGSSKEQIDDGESEHFVGLMVSGECCMVR